MSRLCRRRGAGGHRTGPAWPTALRSCSLRPCTAIHRSSHHVHSSLSGQRPVPRTAPWLPMPSPPERRPIQRCRSILVDFFTCHVLTTYGRVARTGACRACGSGEWIQIGAILATESPVNILHVVHDVATENNNIRSARHFVCNRDAHIVCIGVLNFLVLE